MPGTLPNWKTSQDNNLRHIILSCRSNATYGSAIKRSVSFTILLGKAAILAKSYKGSLCSFVAVPQAGSRALSCQPSLTGAAQPSTS